MTDEESMGRWFTRQTKPQLATYNERMSDAAPYRGSPRWERARVSAQNEFRENTASARYLYEMAMSDLRLFGELTDATNDAIAAFDEDQLIAAE